MPVQSDLANSAKCYCFDWNTFKSVTIYLLASKAGLLSTTPTALAVSAKCYCFDDEAFKKIVAYLLAVNSGLSSSTPAALASLSACYCFNNATEISVISYELASLAGLLSRAPSDLAVASKCYCFNDGTFKSIVVYLLSLIVGLGSSAPPDLENSSKCYCFDGDTWKKVVAYLLNNVTPPPPQCATIVDDTSSGNNAGLVDFSVLGAFVGVQFTASSSYTVCKVVLQLSKGTNTNLSAEIWSDAANLPAARIGPSTTGQDSTTFPVVKTPITYTGLSAALVAGTKYWVVLHSNGGSVNNVNWYFTPNTPNCVSASSSDGITWFFFSNNFCADFTTYK